MMTGLTCTYMTYNASEVNKVFKAQSSDDGPLKNNLSTPTIMHEVIFQHLRNRMFCRRHKILTNKTVDKSNMHRNTVSITLTEN